MWCSSFVTSSLKAQDNAVTLSLIFRAMKYFRVYGENASIFLSIPSFADFIPAYTGKWCSIIMDLTHLIPRPFSRPSPTVYCKNHLLFSFVQLSISSNTGNNITHRVHIKIKSPYTTILLRHFSALPTVECQFLCSGFMDFIRDHVKGFERAESSSVNDTSDVFANYCCYRLVFITWFT